MSDELEGQEELEEKEPTIWEKLGMKNPDEEDEAYEELEEEADEKSVKDNKLQRKLAAQVDDLQKKFEQETLERRKEKFLKEADPVAAEMFRSVQADVKSMDEFDQTATFVITQAETMKKKAAEIEEEMQEKAAKAWGVKPGRASSSVPEADELEEMRGRARMGDKRAAFQLFNSAPTSKDVGIE